MTLQLAIVNKAYSSWSLRPWMLMKHFDIPFEETVIPMARPDTRARHPGVFADRQMPGAEGRRHRRLGIARHHRISRRTLSGAADLAARPGGARRRPGRSPARCTPGFTALRDHCPTQFLRPVRAIALTAEVVADVARIEAAWARGAARFGAGGPFLFGAFSAADAMFAPVVNRFDTYDIAVGAATRDYMAAIRALPAWKAWIAGAEAEPWRIDYYDQV